MSILDSNVQIKEKSNRDITKCYEDSIMNMIRTFHSIGQGGFYTESFKDGHIIVYDCGGNSTESMEKYLDSLFSKNQNHQIDAIFISHLHDDHINGLQYLLNRKDIQVKRLFLPQFSREKIFEVLCYNAIVLENYNINDFVVELNESVQRGMYSDTRIVTVDEVENVENIEIRENDIQVKSFDSEEEYLNVPSGCHLKKDAWLYIPYNSKTPAPIFNNIKDPKYRQEFERLYKLPIDQQATEIAKFVRDSEVDKCKNAYEAIYKTIHNGQSMTVFSGLLKNDVVEMRIFSNLNNHLSQYIFGPYWSKINEEVIPTNFLYTGDFSVKSSKNMDALKKFYHMHKVWETICGVQIPHHGSRNNYNEELYKGRCFAVAAAGAESKYGHPHIDTMTNIIQQGCMPCLVTEHKNTIIFQQFKIF